MNLKKYCLFGIFCTASAWSFALTHEEFKKRLEQQNVPSYEISKHDGIVKYVFTDGHINYLLQDPSEETCYQKLIRYCLGKPDTYATDAQLKAMKDFDSAATMCEYHFIKLDKILADLYAQESEEEKKSLLAKDVTNETLNAAIDALFEDKLIGTPGSASIGCAITNILYKGQYFPSFTNLNYDKHVATDLNNDTKEKFRAWLKNVYKQLIQRDPRLKKEVQLFLYFSYKQPLSFYLGTYDYAKLSEYAEGGRIRISHEVYGEKNASALACLALGHANRRYYLEQLGIHQNAFEREAFHHPLVKGLLFNELCDTQGFAYDTGRAVSHKDLSNGIIDTVRKKLSLYAGKLAWERIYPDQIIGNAYIEMMHNCCDDIAAQWGIIPVVSDDKQLHIFFLEGCDNTVSQGQVYAGNGTKPLWLAKDIFSYVRLNEIEFCFNSVLNGMCTWNNPMPSQAAYRCWSTVMGCDGERDIVPLYNNWVGWQKTRFWTLLPAIKF